MRWLLLLAVVAACGGRSSLGPADDDVGEPRSDSGTDGEGAPDPGLGQSEPTPTTPDPMPGTSTPDPMPGTSTPEPPGSMPDPMPPSDVNCTPNNAKGGQACSVPCLTTCGFYDLGTKDCDCVSGVFVSCHCPRPWNYQGRTTAPPCDTPDGRTHWLDNTVCSQQWAQCIGSDPVSGTNPRGCVCLTDPVTGQLEWTCGSTNKWFLAE